jgi:hypothetical protein
VGGGRLDVLGEQMDRMIHTVNLELKGGAFFSTYLTGRYGIGAHSHSVCIYVQEVHQVCEIISKFILCLVCSSTVHCSILSEISIIYGCVAKCEDVLYRFVQQSQLVVKIWKLIDGTFIIHGAFKNTTCS